MSCEAGLLGGLREEEELVRALRAGHSAMVLRAC